MLGVFQASAAASSARHYGVLVARNLLSFEYPPSAGRSLLPGLYLPFCSVCVLRVDFFVRAMRARLRLEFTSDVSRVVR